VKFLNLLKKAAQTAVPVIIATAMPEAMINTTAGSVLKHTTPINNQSIPMTNLVVSTLAYYLPTALQTGDWVAPIIPALQQGGLLMGMSTALHQSIKIPLAEHITGELAAKVGPGPKFSI